MSFRVGGTLPPRKTDLTPVFLAPAHEAADADEAELDLPADAED